MSLRVLVLHSQYASGASSGENRVVEDEAALLAEHGHDVRLETPVPDDGSAAARLTLGARAVWSRRTTRMVRRIEQEWRPDVIHVHNLFPQLSPAVLRGTGAPVVLTLHNYRLLCLPATFLRDGRQCEKCLGRGLSAGVRHRCYRGSLAGSASLATSISVHRALGTFGAVDRFVAVSGFVRDKYVSAGFASERIAVKPNFVAPTGRRDGPGSDFLYLGRLSEEKGLEPLLRLWGDVPGTLRIVGEGPEGDRLRSIAPPNVEFAGAVPPGDVPALLRSSRALVLPSICYEGAPRTVVEAFAAGVPVIGSRRGAIPEFVSHGDTGALAEPGVAEEWHAAVEMLNRDEESVRMGGNAHHAWRELYSPQRAIEALEGVYADVIARGVRNGSKEPRLGPAVPSIDQ